MTHEFRQIAEMVHQACLMEATARKPGNVHPGSRFNDLCYQDFVLSAQVAAEPLAQAAQIGVGQSIYNAIAATRKRVQTNTNLGIALLVAPLTAVASELTLRDGIEQVIQNLTTTDTQLVYAAINEAQAGGMGQVEEGDITQPPPESLVWAMQQAAERDWIAQQYVTHFHDILKVGVGLLADWRPDAAWESRVIRLSLELQSRWPDSLIRRKCGPAIAEEASRRAQDVLTQGWPDRAEGVLALEQFDQWLRSDGHRRNPGTTADAIAAILFAALRDGRTTFPDWRTFD